MIASLRSAFAAALLGAAGLAALAGADARAEAAFGPLISPNALQELAAQPATAPVILDIRTGRDDQGRTPYQVGHVPGALAAPYGRFRGPAEDPGRLLTDEQLTSVLQSLGLQEGQRVVITHQGSNQSDFGAAARVYWTLKSAGFEELAILNGGVAAWVGSGLPLSTTPTTPIPSEITVSLAGTWLASRDDVLSVVEGRTRATLLDARPESFYKGQAAHGQASRPGTLPQARLFTHSGWFSSGPAIVDIDQARQLAERAGLTQTGDTLISFCNTGHWAATNWFALSELAGIEGVRLYPESMVAWSHAGLPMANTPSRLNHLWSTVRGWF